MMMAICQEGNAGSEKHRRDGVSSKTRPRWHIYSIEESIGDNMGAQAEERLVEGNEI